MQTSRLLPVTLLLAVSLIAAACAGDRGDTGITDQDTTGTQGTTVGPTAGTTGGADQLSVAEQEPYGAFLTDADGRPLYMFTADTQRESSACYDDCAQAWPPLTTTQQAQGQQQTLGQQPQTQGQQQDQGQQPQTQGQQQDQGQQLQAQGQQIQADMVGTIERRNGTMQVTYNGWPLYYYQQDQGSGQVTGQDVQGFGGEWYLVSPEGEQIEEEGGAM